VAFLLDTAIDDQGDEDIGHGIDIAGYGYLRHRQAIEAGEGKESSTLAIGMRFDPTKGVRYGFALFQGTQPRMPDLDYRALELLHGRLDPARNRVVPIKMRRNDRCLCGSGKKTKQCCGLEPGLGSPAPPTP